LLTAAVALPAAETDAERGFARLKSLAGNWLITEEGKDYAGTITIVAHGTAVAQHSDFLLVFHRDHDGLRATLFEDDDNQPRFRSPGLPEGSKILRFDFVDATNVKPHAAVATGLTLVFDAADRFTQRWTFKQDDRETHLEIVYRRSPPNAVSKP